MQRGWDTQTVHAMEIRSETWCASCASGGGGNKGEERGRGLLDEVGVRTVVSTKRRKKGEGRGSGTRDEV